MGRSYLDIPAGINADETSATVGAAAWRDGGLVRFWRGRAETIGGWEKAVSTLLTGVCRTAFPWTNNLGAQLIAFGTHSALQIFTAGTLYDITPTLALPPATLINPFTVVAGSAIVTVVMPQHGLLTGDSIIISGATNVGRLVLNGTFTVTVVDGNTFTFNAGSNAVLVKTLGVNPLAQTGGSTLVTVTDTAHALATGSNIAISGAVDGIAAGNVINGTFPITITGANSYTFNTAANSSATGANGGAAVVVTTPSTGGGAAVVVTPQRAFPVGLVNGTGTAGYSTGGYGVGGFGQHSNTEYFARTSSLAPWGENLMACPRGQTVFWWQNDTSVAAKALVGAPKNVTYMLVNDERQVMAFGCNEELSGVFNPLCIRFSDFENPNSWATTSSNNAGEVILKGGGRIVAARLAGRYIFVWTDSALYLGTFVGDPTQTWRFDLVAERCGLIGPNAAVMIGNTAYWAAPDGQLYTCALSMMGVKPTSLPCTVRRDYNANLSPSQLDKIVASTCAAFDEVRFDYPDARDGFENSRYIAFCTLDGAWTRGKMGRSTYVDAGPTPSPIGVAPTGEVYWHEHGKTADGGPISWFLESADQYIDAERRQQMIRDVEPDFDLQVGPITLTVYTRDYPQDVEAAWPSVMLAPGDGVQDFRAEGRFIRARIEGSSVPAFARIGRISFDTIPTGQR